MSGGGGGGGGKEYEGRPIFLMGPPESRSRQRRCGIVHYEWLEGSEKVLCFHCVEKMWLGPKQLGWMAEHPGRGTPVCFLCARGSIREAEIKPLGKEGGVYYLDDESMRDIGL
jgi:hypothetical protein